MKPEDKENINKENINKTKKDLKKEDNSYIDLYVNSILEYLEEEKQKNIPEVEETKEEKKLTEKTK